MTFHVMIIPTLNCPSNCKYCWGSENKKEMMDIEIIDQIIVWLKDFRDDKVHFTFHGGEPLLAGYDFYPGDIRQQLHLPVTCGSGWSRAGVQPRWIQGIRSGDGVGEDQETFP